MKKTDVIIIGAGPVGLFAVHQLGIKGLKSVVIDNLDKVGGQCIELYPDKPIYDIPAVPECTGKELTKKLLDQIKPFKSEFFLGERVDEVKKDIQNWVIKTNKNNQFTAPNIIIAGGVGSFEPRKLSVKEAEKYEDKSIFYAVKNKDKFKNKNISIFGGGDSALDWALELSKFSKINLIHRRNEFRGAPHTLSEIKKTHVNMLTMPLFIGKCNEWLTLNFYAWFVLIPKMFCASVIFDIAIVAWCVVQIVLHVVGAVLFISILIPSPGEVVYYFFGPNE